MNIAWPKWVGVGAFLIAASGAGAQPAPAQRTEQPAPSVSTVPQATTATYGDWVLRCQQNANGQAAPTCEIVQTLQIEGRGPIAEIALGRVPAKPPLLISVLLPTNVSFPSTVRLSIDDKDTGPAELVWQRCLPAGCFASAEIKDDILRRWRPLADHGRLQFKGADGRDVVLQFSFRGLAQALDALPKA